jgi:hypothetical protein
VLLLSNLKSSSIKLVKIPNLMLHIIDNISAVSFILLIFDLTFPLLLVWFLSLCRTLEKYNGKHSNELSAISRVPLILVSSIVEVHVRSSTSLTLTLLVTMMIGIPLLATCFTSTLDHWCGHEINIRWFWSPYRLQKTNIMECFMQVMRQSGFTNFWVSLAFLFKP